MNPEQQTFNQLSEQQAAGHEKMTVLVKRSGDRISTGQYGGVKIDDDKYAVSVTRADGTTGYRQVSAEALSDAGQAELARKMAGKPLLDENIATDTVPRPRPRQVENLADNEVEAPVNVREGLGSVALSEPEAPELSPLDKLFDKAPVLRMFEEDLRQIADMRRREEGEGPRHGMNQFESSERMIDDLIKRANQVQKWKPGEDRRGAIYSYLNQI